MTLPTATIPRPYIPTICGYCGAVLSLNCPRLGSGAGHVHPVSGWSCPPDFEELDPEVKQRIGDTITAVLAPYQSYLKALSALTGVAGGLPGESGGDLWEAVSLLKGRADEQDADQAEWERINAQSPEETRAELARAGVDVSPEAQARDRRGLALRLCPELAAELEALNGGACACARDSAPEAAPVAVAPVPSYSIPGFPAPAGRRWLDPKELVLATDLYHGVGGEVGNLRHRAAGHEAVVPVCLSYDNALGAGHYSREIGA